MDYREVNPVAELRPFVRCFWHLAAAGDASVEAVETIVPDGCAELVLNSADRFARQVGGDWHEQPEILLVGQIRAPLSIAPTGTVDLMGIRFEPAGLHALFGVPMHELTDLDFCMGQLNPRVRSQLETVAGLSSFDRRVAAAQVVLRGLVQEGSPVRTVASEAVRCIERGLQTVDHVSRHVGVSSRSLERAFRTEVGVAPKLYIRIRRLQSVLARLDAGRPGPDWAVLAAMHNYADQSHLIRDFKLLAGTTPQRYLAERTQFAGYLESSDSSPYASHGV